MDSAQLPDLDGLDREALKALLVQHQEKLLSLAASHENELRSLEAELESQRHILSEQSQELRSSSEQIEHLKLVIEKLRRRVFGVKSEKIVIQLEQLELHLEELESSQAEMEAAVERARPAAEPKSRSRRKPPTEINGVHFTNYIDWMKSCWYISATGNPAVSVPGGFTPDALPVGLQIVGRDKQDFSVLQLSHAFEHATNFARRRPNIAL